jgi:hypothetical protein
MAYRPKWIEGTFPRMMARHHRAIPSDRKLQPGGFHLTEIARKTKAKTIRISVMVFSLKVMVPD